MKTHLIVLFCFVVASLPCHLHGMAQEAVLAVECQKEKPIVSPTSVCECALCLEPFSATRVRIRFDCDRVTRAVSQENESAKALDTSITHDFCLPCTSNLVNQATTRKIQALCQLCRSPLRIHPSIRHEKDDKIIAEEYPSLTVEQMNSLRDLLAQRDHIQASGYAYKPRQETIDTPCKKSTDVTSVSPSRFTFKQMLLIGSAAVVACVLVKKLLTREKGAQPSVVQPKDLSHQESKQAKNG